MKMLIFIGLIALKHKTLIKVVRQGSPRSPDIHDLSECPRLYVPTLRPLLAAQNLLPPISFKVLTLTPNKYP